MECLPLIVIMQHLVIVISYSASQNAYKQYKFQDN